LVSAIDSSINIKEEKISDAEVGLLHYSKNQFITVFVSELNIVPSFLVTQKEAFDTYMLIDMGDKLFPSSTVNKCPETKQDMMDAGKALAFDLATSFGFHVFRVLEAVLKRYWDHISSGQVRPHTIGQYAAKLEQGQLGDKKIWESLKQIASLHRNPLVHPEAVLTVEQAIETLGIARSVMGAMLGVIPDASPGSAHLEPTPRLIPRRAQRVRLQVLSRDRYRCRSCGRAGRLEVDHVRPLRAGGEPYDMGNLQSLCRHHHVEKTREENRRELTPEEQAWRDFVAELA